MASSGVSQRIIAKILNHVERGVTAAYHRHRYDNEKIDAWARKMTTIIQQQDGANVVAVARS
jgi:hypothetical protein